MKDLPEKSEEKKRAAQPYLMGERSDISIAEDKAAREPLVETIAFDIENVDVISIFSINGPWGSGKSVFLRWLYSRLKNSGETRVIYFDSWQFESAGNLVVPLIASLKNTEGIDDRLDQFDSNVDKLVKIAGGVFALHVAGLSIPSAIAAVRVVTDVFVKGRQHKTMEQIEELRTQFGQLVEKILKSYTSKPKRLVFLIDELDRCSPANIVALLESIKNILGTPNTAFVFAIDKKVISSAVVSKYGSYSGVDGGEYLEKIIQFSYELPFDARLIVQSMLQTYGKNSQAFGPNLEFAPSLFELAGTRSIRSVKKVLVRYALLYERCNREVQGGFSPQVLFLLSFLYELFPEIYAILNDFPEQGFIDQFRGLATDLYGNIEAESQPRRRMLEATKGVRIRDIIVEFNKQTTGNAKQNNASDVARILQLVRKYGG